jgi:hypothetical protein
VHEPIVQIGRHDPPADRSSNTSQRSSPNTRIGDASASVASGYCWSVSSLINVDLPAPFGPRIAVCSPTWIDSVSRSSTRVSPRITDASLSSRRGASDF